MNTLKLFRLPTLEIGLQITFFFSLIAFTEMCLCLAGDSAIDATPPIEEIQTIMVKKCLWSPSFKSLAGLDPENLNDAIKAIDQYAQYVPPASLSVNQSRSPRLGIDVFLYKSALWVRPDTDGPADHAGVPEIGQLIAINHRDVSGVDLTQVSTILDMAVRQPKVAITVSNCPGKKGKTYKVRPADFNSLSLMWKRVGHHIIIRIREFIGHDTAPKFAAFYKTVVKARSEVVIDLRGCAGGDLYEAIEIAGMFVPSGFPLATAHDRSGEARTYSAQPSKKLPRPIWLLIDQRTASAAEVLAGILKYYRLTLLVGERSVGKFVSQAVIPLSNGGDLWLTTLEIRLPDGMVCIGKGLDPDISYPNISVAELPNIIKKLPDR